MVPTPIYYFGMIRGTSFLPLRCLSRSSSSVLRKLFFIVFCPVIGYSGRRPGVGSVYCYSFVVVAYTASMP